MLDSATSAPVRVSLLAGHSIWCLSDSAGASSRAVTSTFSSHLAAAPQLALQLLSWPDPGGIGPPLGELDTAGFGPDSTAQSISQLLSNSLPSTLTMGTFGP